MLFQLFQKCKQTAGDLWRWVKRRPWWQIVGAFAIILVLGITLISGGNSNDKEIIVVERHTVTDAVTLSGKTEEIAQADLGFAVSGRIATIRFDEGDRVRRGQLIARLEIDDLLADLAVERATSSGSQETLEAVIAEQNQLVENARRTLYSEGLVAYPYNAADKDTALTPPEITGTYTGEPGEYIIDTYPSLSDTGASFHVSGLENELTQSATRNQAVPLGTHGLFIRFPDTDNYSLVDWIVSIPNTRSPYYVANLNAYESALETRDVAIARARAAYSGGSKTDDINAADARIKRIQAAIKKSSIVAPFSGTVSNIRSSVGETVTAGASVVTVVGRSSLRVKIQVPEIDVARLETGLPATIALDAFPDTTFHGTVENINVSDSIVDGVPVYEGTVRFQESGDLLRMVRTGMTATVTIVIAESSDVVAIPERFIITRDGATFVLVLTESGVEERPVTLGMTGSDALVEIRDGLQPGDRVVYSR